MRILSSIYGPAHLNPVLHYVKAPQDQDHAVRVCAPEIVSSKLKKAGLAHVPYADTNMEELVAAVKGTHTTSHIRIAILYCDSERKYYLNSADAVDAVRKTLGLTADNGASTRAEHVFTDVSKSLGETHIEENVAKPVQVLMPSVIMPERGPVPKWVPEKGEAFIYITFGTQSGTSDRERQLYIFVFHPQTCHACNINIFL